MPIYKWKCSSCGEEREVLRSMKDSEVPPLSGGYDQYKTDGEDAQAECTPSCGEDSREHRWVKQLFASRFSIGGIDFH
jgi:hypothetical protein